MTDDDAPVAEPVSAPIPAAEPVPVAAPEPIAAAEPVPVPEPVAAPEPIAVAEPVPVAEPVAAAVAAPIEPVPAQAFEPELVQPVTTASDSPASSVSIRDIVVRVGAELGRATLPLAKAVGLAPGSVIELDRAADDPIDLYVNGRRFATGQLLLLDQTEWAIRIERVLDVEISPARNTSDDDLI
jgi:flagellar motor switch protein FliN/FliY